MTASGKRDVRYTLMNRRRQNGWLRPFSADSVEKLENRAKKISKCSGLAISAAVSSVEPIRTPAIVFAVIDVVPYLAARETHERS